MKSISVILSMILVISCCGLWFSGCSKEKGKTPDQSSAKESKDKIYNSVDQMPRQINNIQVQYPKDALEKKFEGVVHVKMLLGADGRVQDAEVSVSSGMLSMDLAAVEAAKQCIFSPGLIDGQPVRMYLYKPFNFKLSQVKTIG